MEDDKIVELYLCRDEAAVSETKEKYGNRLLQLSLGIVGDKRTAEECENDTYMHAWQNIPPHEPKDYLYAFLARITRNLSINCCRHRERLKRKTNICRLSAEMEQCIPSPDDIECRIDDIAFKEAINGFLASLNTEMRNVFLRRYWYLDSVSDIGKRYSFSKSKVQSILFRCRNKLREYLEKEGYNI